MQKQYDEFLASKKNKNGVVRKGFLGIRSFGPFYPSMKIEL